MPIDPKDPWYRAETIAPAMQDLIDRLRMFFNVPAINLGSKGDLNHMRGGHRSYNFIKNSPFCTNRTYTVSRTPGDRSGGADHDWLAAMDISLEDARLIPMCKRIDEAVRSGEFEFITEWYGNDDGDNRVDGYDNIANVISSSDSSHLWHAHLTIDRGFLNNAAAMEKLYWMLTGQEEDMDPNKDPVYLHKEVTIPGLTSGTFNKPLGWWISAIYSHLLGTEGNVAKGNAADAMRDAALQGILEGQVAVIKQILDAVNKPGAPAEPIDEAKIVELLMKQVNAKVDEAMPAIEAKVEADVAKIGAFITELATTETPADAFPSNG